MAGEWIEPNFARPTPFLPPEDVRLWDLRRDGRIPTPVDRETGLVDRKAFMYLLRASVAPEYRFRAAQVPVKKTRHHLHWPNENYKNKVFRNQGSLQADLEPIEHNWGHELTIPPDPVDSDVEDEYVDARELATLMRTTAHHPLYLGREAVKAHKEVYAGMEPTHFQVFRGEIREDVRLDLAEAFDIFAELFERARAGYSKFQVIDYQAETLKNVDDMMRIAKQIGKTVRLEAELDRLILDGHVEVPDLSVLLGELRRAA
jgi:hypothetical protein